MQAGEVIETFADIEKSKKLLKFTPTVTLEDGILRFIDWFKQYHNLSSKLEMQLA